MNLRRGPGTDHPIVGQVQQDVRLDIIGRNKNTSWLKIRTEAGRTAWISVDLVATVGDARAAPVVEQ